MKNVLKLSVIGLSAAAMITGCSQSLTEQEKVSISSQNGAHVSFKLTDAPNHDLKSVFVDIDHMEVLVEGKGKSGRLILAKGLGLVDLLQLQNGVTMPLQDIVAPEGISIKQIRLILKSDGHYAVKGDDSTCELKTPSAQKTGVKIILTNKVEFEAGFQYNIVVDFDAKKSVVVQGNGGCLLKPVLKLKSAMKSPIVTDPVGGGEDDGEVVENPGSGEQGEDSGTDDGSSESGTDDGSGEELVTEPNENDPEVDDGWDYTPIVDGVDSPVIDESELGLLL